MSAFELALEHEHELRDRPPLVENAISGLDRSALPVIDEPVDVVVVEGPEDV
jgi:hypothetical protein